MDISDEEDGREASAKDESSHTSNTDSNDNSNETTTPTTTSRPDDEKEKYRLRLEELRAKAKLANAKLRLAKKKRALGSGDDNASALPTPQNQSAEVINDDAKQGNLDVRMAGVLSDSSVLDLTAVRRLNGLVVKVNFLSEPKDKVRFVDTVYQDSSDSDDESDAEVNEDPPIPVEEAKPAPFDSELSRKTSESLKQKLHLAKLRLELKKKKLALEKKKSATAVAEPSSEPPTASDVAEETIEESVEAMISSNNHEDQSLTAMDSKEAPTPDEESPTEPKAIQIQELKRRQKELKQSNEVSHLKNLLQRQRELLRIKGLELTDSSSQLQCCLRDIQSKQEELAASEKRLEEMNHRKRIMEGMIVRATDKLMSARRNLRERQTLESNTASGA
jgi:hypothetical protein